MYTLKADSIDGSPGMLHLDFTDMTRPVGQIETANGILSLALQPWAISFNVSVSANTGAYLSTADGTLIWDETSPTWSTASWEDNSMVFSYDTVPVTDPFSGTVLVNEVAFKDTKNSAVMEFDAAQYSAGQYSSGFQEMPHGSNMQAYSCVTSITASAVTPQPTIRATDAIKSVFPELAMFVFDDLATTFTGAYTVPQQSGTPLVYSVKGTGIMSNALDVTPGLIRSEPQMHRTSEQVGITQKPLAHTQPLFHTHVKPTPHAFSSPSTNGATPLSVVGLMNFDPTIPNNNDPTGYSDAVSPIADKDFHDIICYYMDTGIHTTFISSTPTVLSDSTVQAIATDSPDNKTFYQTLQVPYVTAILAQSTLPEGKQCNGVRAGAQLKTQPANSEVYKRHSTALYQHRFMQKFTGVQQYLDDQANNDYSQAMSTGATAMKNDIITLSAGVNGQTAEEAAATLKAATDDIDSLLAWATSQKLFYAFDLYWYCEKFWLPSLISMMHNGGLSPSVSRTMKKLTLIFGILENSQQNPNGKSFAEAFNDLIRLFQMSTIIPQFVDADATSEDIDSIEKEMLSQFYNDNIGSADPNVVAEAQRAQQLANDDFLRQNFFESLAAAMRLGGTLGSWSAIAQLNQNFLNSKPFYQKLVNAADLSATFMRATCVALLILPMINSMGGGWNEMTPEQKSSWITTAAMLGLTFFIKGTQGALRLYYFWDDLAGFVQTMKAFMGFKSVLTELPAASTAVSSSSDDQECQLNDL